MTFNTLSYEKEDGIGIITFKRPESLNAINSEFLSELGQTLNEIEGDSEVNAFIPHFQTCIWLHNIMRLILVV